MRERPILFSAPMVRAILDGSKTQTRRAIKQQPVPDPMWGGGFKIVSKAVTVALEAFNRSRGVPRGNDPTPCPYGKPGERLWVREKFQPIFADGFDHSSSPYPDYETGYGYAISYPATDGIVEWIDGDDNITDRCRPSIHMPRWASRILLEIVSVRVERLNDIGADDAASEGIENKNFPTGGDDYQDYWLDYSRSKHDADGWPWFLGDPITSFRTLWESINGEGSWRENPWVWVVEFKRILPEEV